MASARERTAPSDNDPLPIPRSLCCLAWVARGSGWRGAGRRQRISRDALFDLALPASARKVQARHILEPAQANEDPDLPNRGVLRPQIKCNYLAIADGRGEEELHSPRVGPAAPAAAGGTDKRLG